MYFIWFVLIIVALIVVHEFGHFAVAKLSGIRVDEFGIGFPPKIIGFRYGETLYSINLIPFGGFVRIFGEDPDEESLSGPDSDRSFVNKPKWIQSMVLLAGVVFNFLFAVVLLSVVFMIGMPMSSDMISTESDAFRDKKLTIVEVVDESLALSAGLKMGDEILSLESGSEVLTTFDPNEATEFIRERKGNIFINYRRGEDVGKVEIAEEGEIGVYVDTIGLVRLNPLSAVIAGTKMTVGLTIAIAVGLAEFIGQIFTGSADLDTVSGPVGIVSMVGDASALGVVYVLNFIAIISIHLTIINLVPFPALDGGRLLFVLVEKVKGSPIKPSVANVFNGIGFILLILLMVVITFNDILRLF